MDPQSRPDETEISRWGRFHLKALLLLIVCVASFLMAWRSYTDLNEATRLSRRFRLGTSVDARIKAASDLGQSLLVNAETALSALRTGLRDDDPRIRLASVQGIQTFLTNYPNHRFAIPGPSQTATALALLEATQDRDPAVRLTAYRTIGYEERPPAWETAPPKEFVSMLLSGASSEDPAIREAAVLALSSRGWRLDSSRSVLLRAIRDPSPRVRIAAIKGLGAGDLGADAEIYLAILQRLDDPDRSVRTALRAGVPLLSGGSVNGTFPKKPPKEIVPALIKLLGRTDLESNAMSLLYRLGPDAAPAVPALIARFEARNSSRSAARNLPDFAVARALARIGPAARPAVPVLSAALERAIRDRMGKELDLRWIAEALVSIAPEAPQTLSLARLLADRVRGKDPRDPAIRAEFTLLGIVGRRVPDSLPMVEEFLSAAEAAVDDDRLKLFEALSTFTWDDRVLLAFERLSKDDPSEAMRIRFRNWLPTERRNQSSKPPMP